MVGAKQAEDVGVVARYDVPPLRVTGSHGPHEAGGFAEAGTEHAVHLDHVAGVGKP